MKKLSAFLVAVAILAPAAAAAFEGIGPRITVVGIIEEITITKDQKYNEWGGEVKLRAMNGQLVTILLQKHTRIISEGRLTRRYIQPLNLIPEMLVRIRGWRLGTDAMNASLVIISNLELNPGLATSGILESINDTSVTILGQDGQSYEYTITAETEVNVNFSRHGIGAFDLIGKQIFLTLNPNDRSYVRIVRIMGNTEKTVNKPSTLELGRPRD